MIALVIRCVRGIGVHASLHAPGEGANDHPRGCGRSLPQCVEETCVNDRPRGVIVRFLSVFSTIEETSTNDRLKGVIVRFLNVPLPTMSEPN
jgi:hypothetical protein